MEKHQRDNNKPWRNKDGWGWNGLTGTANDEIEKFRLHFSNRLKTFADTNMTGKDKAVSQQRTAISSLLGWTHQYCVMKLFNASPRANAHKLLNDPFTISSAALWTHLHPETRCHVACMEAYFYAYFGLTELTFPRRPRIYSASV